MDQSVLISKLRALLHEKEKKIYDLKTEVKELKNSEVEKEDEDIGEEFEEDDSDPPPPPFEIDIKPIEPAVVDTSNSGGLLEELQRGRGKLKKVQTDGDGGKVDNKKGDGEQSDLMSELRKKIKNKKKGKSNLRIMSVPKEKKMVEKNLSEIQKVLEKMKKKRKNGNVEIPKKVSNRTQSEPKWKKEEIFRKRRGSRNKRKGPKLPGRSLREKTKDFALVDEKEGDKKRLKKEIIKGEQKEVLYRKKIKKEKEDIEEEKAKEKVSTKVDFETAKSEGISKGKVLIFITTGFLVGFLVGTVVQKKIEVL